MKFFNKTAAPGTEKNVIEIEGGATIPKKEVSKKTTKPGDEMPADPGTQPSMETAPAPMDGQNTSTGSPADSGSSAGDGYIPGDQSWLTDPIKNTLNTIGNSNLYKSFSNIFDRVGDVALGRETWGGTTPPTDGTPPVDMGTPPSDGSTTPPVDLPTPDNNVTVGDTIPKMDPSYLNPSSWFGSRTNDAKDNNVFKNMDKPETADGGGYDLSGTFDNVKNYIKDNPGDSAANAATGGLYGAGKYFLNNTETGGNIKDFWNNISSSFIDRHKNKPNNTKPPVNETENNPNNVPGGGEWI